MLVETSQTLIWYLHTPFFTHTRQATEEETRKNTKANALVSSFSELQLSQARPQTPVRGKAGEGESGEI